MSICTLASSHSGYGRGHGAKEVVGFSTYCYLSVESLSSCLPRTFPSIKYAYLETFGPSSHSARLAHFQMAVCSFVSSSCDLPLFFTPLAIESFIRKYHILALLTTVLTSLHFYLPGLILAQSSGPQPSVVRPWSAPRAMVPASVYFLGSGILSGDFDGSGTLAFFAKSS